MPKKHLDQKIVDKTVKLLEDAGFSVEHVRVEKCPRRKKPLMVARVNSKAFAIILRNLVKEIKNMVLTSPDDVKVGYLKGLYEAEGSVPGRRITLSMKNFKELQFAGKLLSDLGLQKSVVIRKQQGEMWVLEIYSRKNIAKFQKVVGFGHHSTRNNRLKHLLDSYLYDCFSSNERSEQIRKIIEGSGGKVTASYIAEKMGISYQHTCYLLTNLTNKDKLKVNKLMRPYIYSINSEVNAKNYPA